MQIGKFFLILVLMSDFFMTSAALVPLPKGESEVPLPKGEVGMIALSKISETFDRPMTMADIKLLESATEQGGLKQYLDFLIPSADLTAKFQKELYDMWFNNPLGLADSVFVNTLHLSENDSDAIVQKFFNVACDSERTCDEYIIWLNTQLLPAIELLYKKRIEKIMDAMISQRNFEWAMLEIESDTWSGREVHAERAIEDANLKLLLSLTAVPFLGYSQSLLYESRALRWVSYTACAGLTVTLLYKYLEIIQRTQKKLLQVNANKSAAREKIETLSKRLLPIDVLNANAKKLIEELKKQVEIFATKARDQIRQEMRLEPMPAPIVSAREPKMVGPVVAKSNVRRNTLQALRATLYVASSFTALLDRVNNFQNK